MKFVLCGYYGFGNLGDDLTLHALVSVIRERFPESEIVVLSGNPEETERQVPVTAIPFFSVPRLIFELKGADWFWGGGGSLLQDVTSLRSLLYYLLVFCLGTFFAKQTALVGQGMGPVRRLWLRPFLAWVLNRFSVITVRDEVSFSLLAQWGIKRPRITITADPVFLLDFPASRQSVSLAGFAKPAARVGLILRPLPTESQSLLAQATRYAKFVEYLLARTEGEVHLFLLHPREDRSLCDLIALQTSKPAVFLHEVGSVKKWIELLPLFDSLSAVISMRLHGLIFAVMRKIPAMALTYDPKVTAFAASQGLPCDEGGIATLDSLSAHFEALWLAEPIQLTLQGRHELLKNRALANVTTLFEQAEGNVVPITILGVPFHPYQLSLLLKKIQDFLTERSFHMIVTPNPEIVLLAGRDPELMLALHAADASLCDGTGIFLASKFLGSPLPMRIPGIRFMRELLKLASEQNLSIFLLGGTASVVERATQNIREHFPGIARISFHHGYFPESQAEEVLEKINQAAPDLLFVGMGAPRQEKFLYRFRDRLLVRIAMGVGGSFEVWSGKVKLAPTWLTWIGFEWVYRAWQDPARMRRLIAIPQFIWEVFRIRLGGKPML